MKNPHIGDEFETAFAGEELEELRASVQKEVVAESLRRAMKEQGMSEARLAIRMKTSRTSVRRVLSPDFVGSSFELVAHASAVLGKCLTIVDAVGPSHVRKSPKVTPGGKLDRTKRASGRGR
jgi:antitoxin HicB